jgi:hypothetical protein
VVQTRALTATLGHEVGFVPRDFTTRVRIDLVDPHVVNDRAAGVEVNEFLRAIAHEGVILLLH